jgi:hypothetical protein
MPLSGYINEISIAEIIKKAFNFNFSIQECKKEPILYDFNKVNDWEPDCNDIKVLIDKTINWYRINRWAIETLIE